MSDILRHISFWEKQHFTKPASCCILGGGIVGLFTAYFLKLKFPYKDIRVLERGYPGLGASTKNAGFACFGSPSEILSDIESMGYEKTKNLIRERWKGLELTKSIVPMISMDFQTLGGTELYLEEGEAMQSIEQLEMLNDLLYSAIGIRETFYKAEVNRDYDNIFPICIKNVYEGQLNPLSLIHFLTQKLSEMGVDIVYATNVLEVDRPHKKLHTSHGALDYDELIICTNGFASKIFEGLDDLVAVRNQVLITEPLDQLILRGTYHMNEGYLYFRNYKNRLLIGGARDRDREVETTDQFGENEKILTYLRSFMEKYLNIGPVKIDHHWSGILGVGTEKTPIIRKLDDATYVAVRLGGMGIAIGAGVAKKVVDLIK